MNQFILRHLLGKGGMGKVYEADSVHDNGQTYPVAIKVMSGSLHNREKYTELFQLESLTNLRISHNHGNLVTVFGQFEHADGSLCMVMERVQGCDLRTLLKEYGPLPVDVVLYISARMLAGLRHIHRHGYVHRDLSPGNLLISVDGDVKISDLGLAREMIDGGAEVSRFLGKPAYASPEALRKQTLDPRSDLYSFAAMVFEMVTGAPPYGRGCDLEQLAEQLKNWKLPPMSGIPDALQSLIGELFHEDPARRAPQSAREALKYLGSQGHTDDDEDDANREARSALAEMVAPLYRRACDKRQRQSPIPLGSIVAPVMLEALADPMGDTAVPNATGDQGADSSGTHSKTIDPEPTLDSSEISFSGLESGEEPTVHSWSSQDVASESADDAMQQRKSAELQQPVTRRFAMALAIAAALVLGFVGHNLLDVFVGESAEVGIKPIKPAPLKELSEMQLGTAPWRFRPTRSDTTHDAAQPSTPPTPAAAEPDPPVNEPAASRSIQTAQKRQRQPVRHSNQPSPNARQHLSDPSNSDHFARKASCAPPKTRTLSSLPPIQKAPLNDLTTPNYGTVSIVQTP